MAVVYTLKYLTTSIAGLQLTRPLVFDNLAGLKIIPLVLLTLVENVFQHGDLTNSVYPARITIHYTDQVLRVTTTNLISPTTRTGHQIGLENIRTRLALAYQETASLQANADEKGCFHTDLSIAFPQVTLRPNPRHDP
ncbi:hypothetical protein ACSX1A_10905 [Pontibacter sp. MBLB2868]|uniref:hypothetical protein n=1 Tax=Pontibacter sp. MBLB2868 TaxID=3451555 RepID=UPI003F754DB8